MWVRCQYWFLVLGGLGSLLCDCLLRRRVGLRLRSGWDMGMGLGEGVRTGWCDPATLCGVFQGSGWVGLLVCYRNHGLRWD